MKQHQIHKPYTTTEVQQILSLYDSGKTAKEIAGITGRTQAAIQQCIFTNRDRSDWLAPEPRVASGDKPVNVVPKPAVTAATKSADRGGQDIKMAPREMIKALYDMGYRIENNTLVCYQRNIVKIQDIING